MVEGRYLIFVDGKEEYETWSLNGACDHAWNALVDRPSAREAAAYHEVDGQRTLLRLLDQQGGEIAILYDIRVTRLIDAGPRTRLSALAAS